MRNHLALFALLALVLAPGPVPAQDIGDMTQRLTLAWARGDASEIASLIAERGASINVEGKTAGPLATRQAGAVLRRMFSDVETVGVTLTSKKRLPGEPARAYLELLWVRRIRGTTIPDQRTVFVAMVAEGDGWRITDIRLRQ